MQHIPIREPGSFGKRKEPHKIILVQNGKSRQINISPIVFSVLAGTLFMFLFGYFGATAYLVFRDDLISSSYAQQARMQHEYEGRIAALRSKLDRVTSRQLLDQQAIEAQVKELMLRQQVIGSRDGTMQQLLDQARKRGLSASPASVPVPQSNPGVEAKPEEHTSLGGLTLDTLRTGSIDPQFGSATSTGSLSSSSLLAFAVTPTPQAVKPSFFDPGNAFTQDLFGDVAQAIDIIDTRQREEVDLVRIAAVERTDKISKALKAIGLKVPGPETSNVGGPYEPFDHSVSFDDHIEALEKALKQYDAVSAKARKLPFGNPVPGARISSHFGSRVDPFNGRLAMHSGMDFSAKRGTPVLAAGAGKVIKAGRNGGYGKVVEVRHADGFTTRYAHLSRITVKVGQWIEKGSMVGKVGSTGRSTGPHLHYEVRYSKKPRNPSKYIKAGRKIEGLL